MLVGGGGGGEGDAGRLLGMDKEAAEDGVARLMRPGEGVPIASPSSKIQIAAQMEVGMLEP